MAELKSKGKSVPIYKSLKKLTGYSFGDVMHSGASKILGAKAFKIKIKLNGDHGQSCTYNVRGPNENVGKLKDVLATKFKITREEQYLTLDGRELTDDKRKLSSYGVKNKSTLTLHKKPIEEIIHVDDSAKMSIAQCKQNNAANSIESKPKPSKFEMGQKFRLNQNGENELRQRLEKLEKSEKERNRLEKMSLEMEQKVNEFKQQTGHEYIEKEDKLMHILKHHHLYDDLYDILNGNEYDIDLLLEMEHCDINEFCEEFDLSQPQQLQFRKLMSIIQSYDEVQYQQELMQQSEEKNRHRDVSIIVIGDFGVGKTSLIRRYMHGCFDSDTLPSISLDSMTKTETLSNDVIVNLKIWDTAGQEKFDSMSAQHYRQGECVMVCFDVTDPRSFQNLSYWRRKIVNFGKPHAVMMIIGCKGDAVLDNRDAFEQKAQDLMAKEDWKKYKALYCECSAKTGNNVRSIFQFAAEKVLKQEKLLDLRRKFNFQSQKMQRKFERRIDPEDTCQIFVPYHACSLV